MKVIRICVSLVVIAAGLLFALANREPALLYFTPLPYTMEIPLFLSLFASFIIGLLLGYAFCKSSSFGKQRAIRQKDKVIDALQQEVKALRNEQALIKSQQHVEDAA